MAVYKVPKANLFLSSITPERLDVDRCRRGSCHPGTLQLENCKHDVDMFLVRLQSTALQV